MEKVSRWMEDHVFDAPFTKNNLTEGIGGKAAKVREAVGLLVADGFIDLEITGSGHLHRLVRPYRQADDRGSDRYEPAEGGLHGALAALSERNAGPVDNSLETVDSESDYADRVPASHRVPTASGTRPEPERVPASPAYVVAGMQGRGMGDSEPPQNTEARPSYSVPDEDEVEGDVEEGDW
jgi:hypothetical protein